MTDQGQLASEATNDSSPEPSPSDDLHRVVEGRLRNAELRYTPGRRALVDLLAGRGHPVTIGDITSLLPDLPRSSAYRHLVDLESAGVVRRLSTNDEFARFELAEDITEHHHHLLCTSCGTVIDVEASLSFERLVADHLDRLAGAEGFVPHGHRIDVLGTCAHCWARQAAGISN